MHIDTLKQFIAGNAQFKLPRGNKPVSAIVSALVYVNRVEVIKKGPNRNYYTMKGETHRVLATKVNARDTFRCAFRKYWSLVGRRPFTTRAVSTYFKREHAGVKPPYRGFIRVTLQLLEKTGFATALRRGEAHRLLWAWTEDWKRLSAREKKARLADGAPPESTRALRKSVLLTDERGLSHRHRIDVRSASLLDNIRMLVLAAKVEKANAHSGDRRAVLEAHPVTSAEVEEVAQEPQYRNLRRWVARMSSALIYGAKPFVARHLPTPIVRIGRVRHEWYYDVRETPQATHYVRWLREVDQAEALVGDREITDLARAVGSSDPNAPRMLSKLLLARAGAIVRVAQRVRAALLVSHDVAPLAKAQLCASLGLVKRLQEIENSVRVTVSVFEPHDDLSLEAASACDLEHLPAPYVMSSSAAVAELSRSFDIGRARNWSSFQGMLANVRSAYRYENHADGSEQQLVHDGIEIVDRIDFAMYCTRKYGGPHSTLSLGPAHLVTGACRDATLLQRVLHDEAAASHHEGLMYALGFFDDAESRAAITEWLSKALARKRGVRSLVPQLGAGSIALAPKLFGGVTKTLAASEEKALTAVAERLDGTYAGRVARNVLRAWHEPAHRMTMFQG
ncbi:MAG: hypothetical protein ACYC3F_05590 [Gemmatimonadaceae bacterium]